MPILVPLSWMMWSTMRQRMPGRPGRRQLASDGKGWVGLMLVDGHAHPSKRVGGYGASIMFSGVTRRWPGAALAQVWMDHMCFRPVAASGFRLTLKDGAEPSLGAPGPE